MMNVSIILTCYKQEKYIEETILSVINQKYKDWELLIWDDSPDDNCRNIISKYVKKYPDKIKAWHHNPNKWIVNNMQFLLNQRNKKSEYVAFLEWDDCLFPEYLEKKIKIFDKHPNIQLIYNELTTIDKSWNILCEKKLKQSATKFCKRWKINYEKLLNQVYYMSRSTIMIRSSLLNKYKIFPEALWNKNIISDIYFFNQIAHNEDIYWIEKPLTYYRMYSDSVSGNMVGMISLHIDGIKYVKYLYEKWFIDTTLYKNQICRHFLIINIISIKKFFSMWLFRAIKVLGIELTKSIKIRFYRILK